MKSLSNIEIKERADVVAEFFKESKSFSLIVLNPSGYGAKQSG